MRWKKNNPEKVKAIERRRISDPEKHEKRLSYQRERYRNKRDEVLQALMVKYEENTETLRKRKYEWVRNNPDKERGFQKTRRSRISACEGTHTNVEWIGVIRRQGGKCANLYCRKETKLVKDHIVPVIAKGSHSIENIQGLCASCSSRKNCKLMGEFLKSERTRFERNRLRFAAFLYVFGSQCEKDEAA